MKMRIQLIETVAVTIVTPLIGYVIAYREVLGISSSGISQVRGWGWLLVAVVILLWAMGFIAKSCPSWLTISALLLLAALAVDQLPLLALVKAELVLALVTWAQWLGLRNWGDKLRRSATAVYLVLGTVVDGLYFLALLGHRNLVHVF